jgi:hypothetical protein
MQPVRIALIEPRSGFHEPGNPAPGRTQCGGLGRLASERTRTAASRPESGPAPSCARSGSGQVGRQIRTQERRSPCRLEHALDLAARDALLTPVQIGLVWANLVWAKSGCSEAGHGTAEGAGRVRAAG